MADDTSTTPNKSRRRPAPTIDLSATEVKPEQPASGAPKTDTAPPADAPSSFPRYAGIAGALVGGVILTLAVTWFAMHMQSGSSDTVLRDRIAGLEAQLKATPKPLDGTALGDLDQRLGKIEQALAKPNAIDAVTGERLTAIENSMKALGVTLAALNRRADDSVSAINAMRDQVDATKKAVQAAQGRLDALEQSAKVTQDKVAQNGGADAVARRALAAIALRDAVARGTPYTAELAAVKSLGADEKLVAALEHFAGTGVPTDGVLANEIHMLLPQMIAVSGASATQAEGFFERLQANAGKLVRIHPAGEPAGDEPSAVLARIEVKVARNDIAGIDGELSKLPAKARALSVAWSQKLASRNAALAAARQLAANSAALLGAN